MPHFVNDHGGGLDRSLISDHIAQYLYSVFIALAWCNAIELIVLCFNTFKRYVGCYFWSLLVASACIIPFGLGYILKMFDITFTNNFLELAIVDLGWSGMVTGQSLVLWSRLHLVLQNQKLLRFLLYLIIVDGILLHGTSTALEFYQNARPHSHAANLSFGIIERIQLPWFCAQELLLSLVYIVQTVKLLRLDQGGITRTVLTQLMAVNVVIIVLDLSVVVVQYLGLFTFQVTFKSLVYSIKLKLEYIILGRLVEVAHIRTQRDAPRLRL
ncbi:integral membrane protein [Aspergillus terreus]|uniref:Integral membrane protein n=1 Tax=Aspergillus terreus TaxID=33178 RepID=A0A5M3Z9T7_ASPTE|nr:hypothetical protein ATETN484_0011054600 [Aspergillus terreus]GFF19188.1 integral membrane protein [Aspergillus terreus]